VRGGGAPEAGVAGAAIDSGSSRVEEARAHGASREAEQGDQKDEGVPEVVTRAAAALGARVVRVERSEE